jgi:hypothetical protein
MSNTQQTITIWNKMSGCAEAEGVSTVQVPPKRKEGREQQREQGRKERRKKVAD